METIDSWPTTPFPEDEYRKRIAGLQRRAARAKVDALFVETPVNRLYLTGFRASNGVLLLEPGRDPCFYTDFRYLEMARKQLSFVKVAKLGKLPAQFGGAARRRRWRSVGYEGALTAGRLKAWREAMPSVETWKDVQGQIAELRSVKSALEQEVMRRAAHAGDRVFRYAVAEVSLGRTEWDARRIIRSWADRLAQGEGFSTIVCAGANASRCHHSPGLSMVRPGQGMLVDMGVLVQDYMSDMTRVVFYGRPSKKLAEIYKIVLAANRRAIRAVCAGKRCDQIDAVGRRVIEKAGYGKYFGHGLGHGIGLEVHESPRFAKDNKTVLKPGMILTVEPGIYLPGVGGVRIEDMVLVRRSGCDVLTGTPKELTCL
jgi:Xaa-Pro aminopeptidase